MIFPYLKQNHSTPSLVNDPDTDSYQDTFSQFSPLNTQSIPDPSPTQTFTKDKTVSNDSTPKYQNLSCSSSLHDRLDNALNSTNSDFEMLPNPNYYSNSSNNSFPQTFPRIADSHNTSLNSPNDPQTVLNYTRAPHSPYNLSSLPQIPPPHYYKSSRPNISFPP